MSAGSSPGPHGGGGGPVFTELRENDDSSSSVTMPSLIVASYGVGPARPTDECSDGGPGPS